MGKEGRQGAREEPYCGQEEPRICELIQVSSTVQMGPSISQCQANLSSFINTFRVAMRSQTLRGECLFSGNLADSWSSELGKKTRGADGSFQKPISNCKAREECNE